MKGNAPVVVAEFTNSRDAAIAAGMLENNGIACHVMDDAMSTLYGAGATWPGVRQTYCANTATTDANKAACESVLLAKTHTYHRH